MTPTAGHRWARRTRRLLLIVAGLVAGCAAAAFGYWTVAVLYAPTNYATAQANSVSAPSAPTATVNGSGAITVGWSLPGSQLTGAQFQVTRTSGPGSPATVCTVASNVTSCQDSGLTATTAYGYSIVGFLYNWQTTAITTSATTATPTLSVTLSGSSTTAGSSLTVQTITAKNGAITDTTYTGSKTLTWSGLNNSPSGFSPSYPSSGVTFSSGVASPASTFTPYEAGSSRTLVATDSNATGVTGSVAFTVSVATANKLLFTTQPVGAVAEGTNFSTSPTVTVTDTYGNVATGDTGTVTLTINTGPGAGVVSCSNTGFPAVAAVAGVVAFTNCQITGTAAAGTYTLAATRSGLTPTGASSGVVISVGSANKLVFTTQPVGAVAEGTNFSTSPTVSVQDSYSNVVTSDTGTVTLAKNSGPGAGVLNCSNANFPAVAAVAGVVAFTNCQVTGTAAAGTYTLAATRSGLTPTGASSGVVISVGSANKLVFTTQPVGAVAEATNLSTSPTVSVQDSFGNVVTSDTGTVTLAKNSGPAAGSLTCSNASFPAVAAVAGVVGFTNCQVTGTAAAGTYTLAATRGGLTSTGASSNVVINVGSANKLVFTTQPVGAVIEATNFSTSPAVSVQDSSGNLVTSDTGTVTLVINTGAGSGALSCSNAGFPTVAAVAGVVTFTNCQVTGTAAAGTYTLAATRVALTSTGASSNVVINVGAANKLVFTTQPVGAVAEGTNFSTSPAVSVEDSFSNVVTSDTGTVTLAKNTGPTIGALSCSNAGFPAVAAVAGVAAFTNCQFTGTAAAGTYTLAATRAGLTATGASNNVVINVGTAAGLSFSNVSTNNGAATVTCSGTVGSTSFACTISPESGLGVTRSMTANVIVIDQFQNLATNSSGNPIPVALTQLLGVNVSPTPLAILNNASTSSQSFTESLILGGIVQGTVTATATVNSTSVQAKITS